MKKIILFFTIILISIVATASIQNKISWWENNLQREIDTKEKLNQKKETDSRLISYLNKKISRSKSVLTILKSDRDSLNSETQNFSKKQIDKIVSEKLNIHFSLNYLEILSKTKDTNKVLKDSKQRVINNIISILPKNLNKIKKEVGKQIYIDFFHPKDLKALSLEIRIADQKTNKERIYNIIKNNISKIVKTKMKDIKYISNKNKIHKEINIIVQNFIAKNNLKKYIKFKNSSIKNSWNWKSKEQLIKNKIKRISSIYNLTKDQKNIKVKHLFSFNKHPLLLDKAIFENSHNLYLIKNSYPSYIKKENSLRIPNQKDLSPALKKMDIARKELLSDYHSDSKDFESKFNKIIEKYTNSNLKIFNKEIEKIRTNKTKYSNLEKFNASYKIFLREKNLLYGYKSKSIEFINIVKTKFNLNTNSLNNTKYRIKINKKSISFIKDLVRKSNKPQSNIKKQKLKDVVYHTSKLISKLKTHLYFGNFKSVSNINEIKEIKFLKKEHFRYLTLAQSSIFNMLNTKNLAERNHKNNNNKLNKNLLKSIAQYEIDKIFENIEDAISLYNKIGDSNKELTEFQELFLELQNDARKANLTHNLEFVIKEKSILPLLKNIDLNKIEKNNQTKKILKKDIFKSIAILKTIIHKYKRNKIIPDFLPNNNELNSITKNLKKKNKIKIGSWLLSSKNFKYINPRAAKHLAKIYNTKIWEKTKNQINYTNEKTLTLNKLKINFDLPAGLLSNNANPQNNSKEYTGIYNDTKISLTEIDNKFDNLDLITLKLTARKDLKPLKQKWGKKKNSNYYWLLTRDKEDNLIEIFTIRFKNSVLIFIGKTDKIKYNFFTEKFKESFNSIEFELLSTL